MSKQSNTTTTNSWVLFTWVSFIVAIIAMGFAVIYIPMDNLLRAY